MAIEEWRQQQVARKFSLSEFMKAELRFSRWYNHGAGRKGTLWEGRITSVIVEEEERALRTMAAYIDLNPVRAGIEADPADYLWSLHSTLSPWCRSHGQKPELPWREAARAGCRSAVH